MTDPAWLTSYRQTIACKRVVAKMFEGTRLDPFAEIVR